MTIYTRATEAGQFIQVCNLFTNSWQRLSILLHHLPYWMLYASGYLLLFLFIYQFSSSYIMLPMNDSNDSLIMVLSAICLNILAYIVLKLSPIHLFKSKHWSCFWLLRKFEIFHEKKIVLNSFWFVVFLFLKDLDLENIRLWSSFYFLVFSSSSQQPNTASGNCYIIGFLIVLLPKISLELIRNLLKL